MSPAGGPVEARYLSVELIEAWLDYLAKTDEARENTIKAYRRALAKFRDWLGPEGAYSQVTPEDMRRFKSEMLGQFSSQSTNLYLVAVRSFYAYLVSQGLATINPAREIKGPKRRRGDRKREALTPAEVRALLAQPDPLTREGARDKVIITLMLYTAVRCIEIHRANWGDLGQKGERLVLYVQGKTRRTADELVVIPRDQEALIRDYVRRFSDDSRPDSPLFISYSRRTHGSRLSLSAIRENVKRYFKMAKISGGFKTTHSLRHTAIINAIRHGALPMAVQAMARHKSFDTTLGYFREAGRLENPAEDLIKY